MNRNLLLSFLIFFLLTLSLSAQKTLQVTGARSGRLEIIKPNTELIYRLNNDSTLQTYHGRYSGVTDSTVMIDEQPIAISNLKIVGIRASEAERERTMEANRALGNGLIIAGDIVTHVGLNIFINDDFYIWPVGGSVALVGVAIWGLGLLVEGILAPVVHDNQRAKLSENWNASIVDAPSKKGKKKKNSNKDEDLYGY